MQEGGSEDRAPSGRSFEFLPVERPTTRTRAASSAALKRVRSHVAKVQHQRERQKIIARRRKTATEPDARPKHPPNSPTFTAGRAPVEDDGSSARFVPPAEQSSLQSLFDGSLESDEMDTAHNDVHTVSEKRRLALPWNDLMKLMLGGSAISFSQGKMSFRTFALDDPTNTVGACLNELGFDVSSTLGYYKLMVQIQGQDYETQFSLAKNSVWEKYFSFVFRDPALLTVAVLLTVRHRLESLNDEGNVVYDHMQQLLQLETFLIQKVNSALNDANRALSDPMLVVVALCASYGLKCGNLEAYHIHMGGLVRMIRRRGGLDVIGRQDRDLERWLMWQDVNTATMLGRRGYLVDMQNSTGEARPASNVATFRAPMKRAESTKPS